MTCTLDKKQQEQFYAKVFKDLLDHSALDTPFNFKNYAANIYKLVVDKTGDPALGVSYVNLLPQNIRLAFGRRLPISKMLAPSISEILDYEDRFQDVDFVSEFVSPDIDKIQELQEKTEQVQQESLDPEVQQTETPEAEQEVFEPEWNPMTFLKDVQPTNQTAEYLAKEKFYNDIKEKIIDAHLNAEEGAQPFVDGVGGVRLTLMSDTRLDKKYLREGTAEFVGQGGVALVVTGLGGEIIYFDSEGKRASSDTGKPAYYNLAKNLNKSEIESFSKQRNVSLEEARAVLERQYALANDLREYINKSPESNEVRMDIKGGMFGTPLYDNKMQTPPTIGVLDWTGKVFAPVTGEPGNKKESQFVYFDFGAVKHIQVERPVFPQKLAVNLASILLDDLQIESDAGKHPITNTERIELFKSYALTSSQGIEVYPGVKGAVNVKIFGKRLTGDKEEIRSLVLRHLTLIKPTKELVSETEISKHDLIAEKSEYTQKDINKKIKRGDKYFLIEPAKQNVVFKYLNKSASDLKGFKLFDIADGVVTTKGKAYNEYLKENFVIFYPVSGGKISTTSPSLQFAPAKGEGKKLVKQDVQPIVEEAKAAADKKETPQEKTLTSKEQIQADINALIKKNRLHKILSQKNINKKITEAQLAEAKIWYSTHPLSKVFPFQEMFALINKERPNSIATWEMNGITLYKGADYSDLYHEAWHGFTQGFLSRDDKTNLYNETRKKSGSFLDYTGKTVQFRSASDLQLEEYLAEDFRSYMLSNGKVSNGSPIRNSIFRRIWNFLKSLFGDVNINEIALDNKANATLRDLYEKLRIGDLSGYTFSEANANFDILNKGIEASNKDETQKSLDHENSRLVMETVDSLFSEYADASNGILNDAQKLEKASLELKLEKTEEESARLKELQGSATYEYATKLFSSDAGLKDCYGYTKLRLSQLRLTIAEQLETETNPSIQNDLQRRLDTLDYALRNFGDTDNIRVNKPGVDVVGYHLFKSELVNSDVLRDIQEEQDNAAAENEGFKYFDKSGNEVSVYDLAKQEVRYMITGLYETNKDGEVQYNSLGVPKLAPYRKSFNRILAAASGLSTLQKMYEALQAEVDNYPPIKQLLEKLGPPAYPGQSETEVQNWVKFWQTMNKYRINLKQMTVNEVTRGEDGKDLPKRRFDATIGAASDGFRAVQRKWAANIQQPPKTDSEKKFIVQSVKGNYLDLDALVHEYPSIESIKGKEFEFLRDLGIILTDDKGARKALQKAIDDRELHINTYVNRLKVFKDHGYKISSPGTFLGAHPKIGLTKGDAGDYKKLAQIEEKFSGSGDASVSNAVGDKQYEYSQNTSVTQIVKAVNESDSFIDLVSKPHMAYLAITLDGNAYNAFSKNSQWLNSIFDMSANGGPKRKGAVLNIENLSGVALTKDGKSTDNGVISASADAATKLIYDLHLQLMAGTPELVRAADKKTSLSVWVSGVKLYVDTPSFFNTAGERDAFKILFPYIKSELDRVRRCRELLNSNVQGVDFNYLKRGSNFVMFEGVLSEETKDELYDLAEQLSSLELNGVKLDDYFSEGDGKELREKIYGEVTDYFTNQVQGVTNKLNETPFGENMPMFSALINEIKAKASATVAAEEMTDKNAEIAAVKSYVYNNWIHHFEESILLFGDPAQYNMGKEEYQKRIASANSTGDLMATDPEFIEYINSKVGRPLAKSKGLEQKAYDGTFDTAVFSDIKQQARYYKEYVGVLGGEKAAEKYGAKGVNVGDAQGWMSFDSYRIVGKSLGDWTDTQEKLYQKIVKNQISPDEMVMEFFPVRKMSYFGSMQGGVMPLTALHKFSLFPLIPSAIKGTNLEKLHDKMMREGIDYALFESGSKISTVTKDGTTDKISQETPFTKNTVFADYLKNQIEVAPKFKKSITFFTQLRKLVDLGLMENGVPTDYTGGKESWNKLKEADKRKASARYSYRQAFLDDVFKLGEIKKKELLDEMGWTLDKNGKPTGDMKSLLRFVSSELERSDLGDHEREFLQIGSDGKLKHDLSLSLSADKIEKILVALVNKRLVRYKVNGEWLVQVSSAGFEKPTPEQAAEYGASDLTTYHKGADGKTKAAKCKISLQGQFRKLLTHPDVITKSKVDKIGKLEALNALLKDEGWLDTADHRAMITMIGARIPTQGLNSMEFAEVYEFLPETAGNIIIMPPEITSKSGTDYDFDKLPMMMPNLHKINGKVGLFRKYKNSEIAAEYETYKKIKVAKDNAVVSPKAAGTKRLEDLTVFDRLVYDLAGSVGTSEIMDLDEDVAEMLLEEGKLKTLQEFTKEFDKPSNIVENNIIQHTKDMLELPENFANLIRPNDTNLVEPLAKEMAKHVEEGYTGKKGVAGNQIFEILYNLNKHQYNSVGKQIVGITAANNAYNPILNGIGAYLNSERTEMSFGKKDFEARQEILLPHNSIEVGGKKVISLAGLKDANNENDVAEIISQILNGGLDVAKDAWVFFLQANKEITGTLLFMVEAGVPIKNAVYLVSQPLVREYVRQRQLFNSTFSSALGKTYAFSARKSALAEMLENPKFGFLMGAARPKEIYNKTVQMTTAHPKALEEETLLKNITSKKKDYSDEERAAFLHFIEIENMAQSLTNITTTTNIDTTPTADLYEAESKNDAIQELRQKDSMPAFVTEAILKDTTIGAYAVQDFTLGMFQDLFKLRNNPLISEFIQANYEKNSLIGKSYSEEGKPSEAKFNEAFRSDLINYIFQNSVRAFDVDVDQYKGSKVSEKVPVQEVENLKFGAFIKDNVLYVDKNSLKKQFEFKDYARIFDDKGDEQTSEYERLGLAAVGQNAFKIEKEYIHFVYERESLRTLYPYNSVQINGDYLRKLNKNLALIDYKKKEESTEAFEKRMKRRSYEEFLRDKALDNILNPWQMFRSYSSYADQFVQITQDHPELLEQYYLLQNLQLDEGLGFRNLKLGDSRVDKDQINLFHENLMNLANNSIVKVTDAEENERISNFFARFPLAAFMQSGMNTKSAFSMTRIVPQEMFIALMEKPAKEWQEKMSSEILKDYYDKFVVNNLNRGERVRSKDYLSNATLDNPIVKVEPIKNIKDEIRNVISGEGEVRNGKLIQTITHELRGTERTIPSSKRPTTSKKQEEERLKKIITEKGLWFDKSFEYLGEGEEQRVYRYSDPKYVVKENTGKVYGFWEDYLDNLLLHNYFFPDTSYELLGFKEINGGLVAVVKQPYVEADAITNLEEVKSFLADNGFVNKEDNDYENLELGINLQDLHNNNVLTMNGVLHFIDTVFYTTPNLYDEEVTMLTEIKPQPISDEEVQDFLNNCFL